MRVRVRRRGRTIVAMFAAGGGIVAPLRQGYGWDYGQNYGVN